MAETNHTDVVREHLLKQLIHGVYAPGHVFKLRELLQVPEFKGMSQTPIREALQQLVAKDILVGQRGFSVRVPIPSVEHLAEVRAIRTKLEIMATLNTLGTWTDDKLAVLTKHHQALLAAKSVGDVKAILTANVNFHFTLYGDRKSYLVNMITTLWAITGPSIPFLYQEGKPLTNPQRHPHDDVIDGLRTGDAELLTRGITEDLSGTGERILQVLKATLAPEALTIRAFEPMQLVRKRVQQGKGMKTEGL